MTALPASRFEWERLVRRSRLAPSTKLVAFVLSQFADPDGTRCRPGNVRLAATTGVSDRTIRRGLEQLRSVELVERVTRGSSRAMARGTADEYRLTIPGDWLDTLQALDLNERPLPAHGTTGSGWPQVDQATTGSGWPQVDGRPAATDDSETPDLRSLTTRPPVTDDTTSGHGWPTTIHDHPETNQEERPSNARATGCPHGDPRGPDRCALCRQATAPWDVPATPRPVRADRRRR